MAPIEHQGSHQQAALLRSAVVGFQVPHPPPCPASAHCPAERQGPVWKSNFSHWWFQFPFRLGQRGSRSPDCESHLVSEEIQDRDKAGWEKWWKVRRGGTGKESLHAWGGLWDILARQVSASCNRKHHGLRLHRRSGPKPERHHLLHSGPGRWVPGQRGINTAVSQAGSWLLPQQHFSCKTVRHPVRMGPPHRGHFWSLVAGPFHEPCGCALAVQAS